MPEKTLRSRRNGRIAAPVTGVAAVVTLISAAVPALTDGSDDATAGTAAKGRTVDVQMLSFNDFHGNLEPPDGSSGEAVEKKPDGSTQTRTNWRSRASSPSSR